MGVHVTDTATERRYSAAVDGPAHSCLALPLRSGGLDGELLAVLSVRKLFPELMTGAGVCVCVCVCVEVRRPKDISSHLGAHRLCFCVTSRGVAGPPAIYM